jgi:hypothetical protein
MEEEMIEKAISGITELLRSNPFTIEFKVVKKPRGIKIVYEVTQEEMDMMAKAGRTEEEKV